MSMRALDRKVLRDLWHLRGQVLAIALVIGVMAGVICFNATLFIKRVLKIDDSLDVFPVHGVGGILGTLMAGVFSATSLGVFSGYGFADGISSMAGQLKVQFIGVIATIGYTAVASYLLLKITGFLTSGLRVSEEQEIQGLAEVDDIGRIARIYKTVQPEGAGR